MRSSLGENVIIRLTKPYSESYIYSILDSQVGKWFKEKYGSFTPPQRYSIAEIHKGNNILISSPTGSGKTLSAFLAILSELISLGRKGELKDQIYCLYVSPLKALNNDIRRNLEEPLSEIKALFVRQKLSFPEIRIAVRTGDTSPSERAKMLRKPPHILITTPESLAIMLSTPKMSKHCETIRWVIVDELHALAENKRGTSLAISLERLTHRIMQAGNPEPVRIGLSATVYPLDEMAKFLVGKRTCRVVDVSYEKKIKLEVATPAEDLIYDEGEKITTRMYQMLKQIIQEHRTTLIFTNTRSATESVAHKLRQLLPKAEIYAHHSSLSKEVRLEVEQKLKEGKAKVVVSSTSLELGIDIGAIDVVVLLGSPKSVARALQRVGRSGHRLHETSKGILLALDRDDLIEVMMIAKCAKARELDRIRIIKNALDVLTQHLVGMALEKKWSAKEAFELVRKAYPYHELSWEDFASVLEYLSGYHAFLEEKNVFGKIWYDGESFGKRGKSTRMMYYVNSGTIPEESYVDVLEVRGFAPKRWIGKIEEEFAEWLKEGDVFVLGGKTYEYVGSMGSRVLVVPVEEKMPTVPRWFSEMLPLAYELAGKIQALRMRKNLTKKAIMKEFEVSESVAEAVIRYFREQWAVQEEMDRVLIEEWLDDEGHRTYIFQFVAGKKANEAIARVLAYRIGQEVGCNVGVKLNDYGIALILPEVIQLREEVILKALEPEGFTEDLKKAVENTELLRRRFRHVAVRSFLVLRQYKGKNISLDRQQSNANALLTFLMEHMPDFPVLKETFREVMEDAMHVDEAIDYLKRMKGTVLIKRAPIPSPFSFSILAEGTSDVVVIENRREFIKRLHSKFIEYLKVWGKA